MKIKVINDKMKTKVWRKMFFVICIILLITTVWVVMGNPNPLNPQPDSSIEFSKTICSQIQGTPAWVQNEEIIGYGYGFPEEYSQQSFSDIVNNFLIPNKITFVYNSKCGYCQKQIISFGDSWDDYQDSGLVIQCDK